MRDMTLRWGLGMGVLAAAIGTGALLLGAVIAPFKQVTTADAIAIALFVRGILVLISLGIALGLSYYAGMRVAHWYFQSLLASSDSTEATGTAIASMLGLPINRRYTVLAGGLTMFCFWLITSMYIFVLPPTDAASAPQTHTLSFLETRLVLGIIYVLFGLGLGGLGGRAPAARLLLDRLAVPKPSVAPPPVSASQIEPAQPAPAGPAVEAAIPSAGAPAAEDAGRADLGSGT